MFTNRGNGYLALLSFSPNAARLFRDFAGTESLGTQGATATRRVSAWLETVVSATTASNTSVLQADSNICSPLIPPHRKLKEERIFY